MKHLFLVLIILLPIFGYGQNHQPFQLIAPEVEFENVLAVALNSDSLSLSYLFWVKKTVTKHFHCFHTSNIYVLEGSGLMLLGTDTLLINEGDHIVIEPNTHMQFG